MGGLRSGRQKSGNTKQTVEESIVLDLNLIFRAGLHPREMTLNWKTGYTEAATITYIIGVRNGHPTLTLGYICNSEPVKQNIPIIWVPQPYGGVRYWMECTLRNGPVVSCDNRCSKLYLPPGGKYFGCRKCHNLTYNSCNVSHSFDSYYKDFVQKHGPYPRKKFNEEFSGKWYYKYFRTRKAAKKWYAKAKGEKGL